MEIVGGVGANIAYCKAPLVTRIACSLQHRVNHSQKCDVAMVTVLKVASPEDIQISILQYSNFSKFLRLCALEEVSSRMYLPSAIAVKMNHIFQKALIVGQIIWYIR